jgi:2-dehydropantoate 2-reductase
MRIAIVGPGGVGGLLAGLLARAGEEVVVLARGRALEAVRAEGLAVDSPLGTFTQRVAACAADPAALGRADAVVVAVKAWQVAELAPSLAPLVGPATVVVPLQNGVLAAERLAAALGEGAVANGLVSVIAWLEGPGRVKHIGMKPRVVVGERGGRGGATSPRLEALAAALVRAGCEASVSPDVERASWEKYLLIEPWGAVAAAARAPMGVVRSVPETRRLLAAAQEELAAVARARGVAVPEDAPARTLAFLDGVTPEATASMQRDLGAGRPSELEEQTGALVRLAREAGVPVPIHEVLLAALLPQELAARGRVPPFQRT